MTKEIVALLQADERVNGKKPAEKCNIVFLAKAMVLLCMARKSRDADYMDSLSMSLSSRIEYLKNNPLRLKT